MLLPSPARARILVSSSGARVYARLRGVGRAGAGGDILHERAECSGSGPLWTALSWVALPVSRASSRYACDNSV